MKVPFLDLNAHHAPLRGEFERAIAEVIDSGAFAGGPFVARFRERLCRLLQCEHAMGVGKRHGCALAGPSGLRASGPATKSSPCPSTFMATAEAITYCGAKPVFVDVDERTYTMDPAGWNRH